MPHHSAQTKRQMTAFPVGSSTGSAGGGGVGPPPPPPPMMTASMSFPPRSAYAEYPHRHPGVQGTGPPHTYASFHTHIAHHHQAPPPPHLQPHPPVSMASSWATSSPSGSSVNNAGVAPGNGGGGGAVVHRVDLHDDALHQPHLLHPAQPHRTHSAGARGVGGGGGGGASVSSRSGGGAASVVDEDAMSSASTHGGTTSGSGTGGGGAGTPRLLLPNEHSRSFDSTTPHEVAAASVLLLAATAMKECGENARVAPTTMTTTSAAASTPTTESERHEPERKKRKQQTAAGIMRKKSNDASQASHVSPYSQSSAADDNDSPKTATTTTPVQDRRHGPSGTSPTSSYDLKDGQALHDSAKINDPKDIALSSTQGQSAAAPSPHHPSHAEIPHFPSVLHAVLTESEFAGKVLLWLPHGQAWRIVRWDALRKLVLPKYFAQLNEDSPPGGHKDASSSGAAAATSSSPSGSIDAFLWHLSAWGFEEVNDGPDVGAYSHVLFRRELPGLCREMRFAPSNSAASTTLLHSHKDLRSADVGGVRYILQVPSLASTGGAPSSELSRHPGDEDKVDDRQGSSSRHLGSSYPNQVTPAWPSRPHVSVGYHPHTYHPDPHPAASHNRPVPGSGGGQWKYYPEPSQWVGSLANPATETSSPTSVTSQRSVPPYSPIRVRSGRGAGRLPLNRSRTVPDVDPVVPRSSFPVSNRGKGGKAAVRRVSHPCPSESPLAGAGAGAAAASSGAVLLHPSSPGDDGADSIANKPRMSILKRKLPLMRKSLSSSSPSPFVAAGADDDHQGGVARVYTPTDDLAESSTRQASPSADRAEEEKKEEDEGVATQYRGASHASIAFEREEGSASPVATQVTPV